MTDKIKVWKCDGCDAADQGPCISNMRFRCNRAAKWKEATGYEINRTTWQTRLAVSVFTEQEKQEIIKTAERTVKKHPIAFAGIIRTLELIGNVHSVGGSIESLIKYRDDFLGSELKESRTVFIEPTAQPTQITEAARLTAKLAQPGPVREESGCSCPGCQEARGTATAATTPTRHRVKIIWSEVGPENVRVASALRDFTATIRNDDIMVGTLYGPRAVRVSNIPKTWLEKIDDEPVSAEKIAQESIAEEDAYDMNVFLYGVKCVKAGETNNELKHQQHQTLEETKKVFSENNEWNNDLLSALEFGWHARGDSHNLY